MLLVLIVLATTSAASAAIIRPEMTCSAAREVIDSHDRDGLIALGQFIADAFYEADRPFVQAGRGSIMPPNDDGLYDLVALVTGTCASHMDQTVRAHVKDVYKGLRALGSDHR